MADGTTSKHRSRSRTIADILHGVQSSDMAKITYLVHEANLPHGRLTEYLTSMKQSGLIDEILVDGQKVYKITTKGITYLREFKKFEDFGILFGVEI